MKITIVRHGETIQNSLSICQGQSEGTLSEKGILQAEKVAERLQNENFDRIISSDLERAWNTAKIIAKHHSSTPIHSDIRLRERHFGAIQGKQIEGYDINNTLPDDAESNEAIVARHASFYAEIIEQYQSEHLLLVSHGIAKKALLTAIFNLDANKLNELERFGNTSVTIIEQPANQSATALLRNCMAHLDE